MWFACALDKACIIERQFLEAAKVAQKCWFHPVFLTSLIRFDLDNSWEQLRVLHSLCKICISTDTTDKRSSDYLVEAMIGKIVRLEKP